MAPEKRRQIRVAAYGLAMAVAFYLGSAIIIFDFGEAAYPHDEEYFGNKHVAFGPRPRASFCKPAYAGGFDGTEWPLRMYRPVCEVWRYAEGYAAPTGWR